MSLCERENARGEFDARPILPRTKARSKSVYACPLRTNFGSIFKLGVASFNADSLRAVTALHLLGFHFVPLSLIASLKSDQGSSVVFEAKCAKVDILTQFWGLWDVFSSVQN